MHVEAEVCFEPALASGNSATALGQGELQMVSALSKLQAGVKCLDQQRLDRQQKGMEEIVAQISEQAHMAACAMHRWGAVDKTLSEDARACCGEPRLRPRPIRLAQRMTSRGWEIPFRSTPHEAHGAGAAPTQGLLGGGVGSLLAYCTPCRRTPARCAVAFQCADARPMSSGARSALADSQRSAHY